MKFDKRFVLAAALLTGLGFSTIACSDDDDDKGKKEETKCELTAASCTDEQTWNEKDCKCDPKQASTCEKAESDCTDGKKLDKDKCECVEDKGGEECTLECKADDHKKLDSDKCECVCDTGYKAGENADAACVVDEEGGDEKCKGEHEVADGDTCKCETGYHYNKAETPVCEEDITESEKCNDGTVDDDEVCDNKDGVVSFKEGYGSCVDYYKENSIEVSADNVSGTPSCGNTCKTLAEGSCKRLDDPCGNNVLDEGEFCDTVDGVVKFADEAAATCSNANMGAEGKPGCNAKCDGYSKGDCHEAGEVVDGVNGVAKCGSNLAISESSATAKVTYTLMTSDASKAVKAGIVCSSSSATIDADVVGATLVEAADGSVDLTADLSKLTAGEYVCYIAVKVGDNGAVVCPLAEGKPAKASGEANKLEGSTVSYSVAASSEILAVWNDFSASDMNTKLTSEAGMAPNGGSLTSASLRFVAKEGTDFNIKKGQSADGSSVKALIIGGKSVDKGWATEEALTTDTNSYLVINGLENASNISVTATEAGGHMVVMAGDNKLIDHSEAKASGAWPETATKSADIPTGTTSLTIYAYGVGAGNLIIDNITIK